MKVEEIAEAVAALPQDQLARFRRWFTAFEAGRADHAEELELHRDQTRPLRRPDARRVEKTREGTVTARCRIARAGYLDSGWIEPTPDTDWVSLGEPA